MFPRDTYPLRYVNVSVRVTQKANLLVRAQKFQGSCCSAMNTTRGHNSHIEHINKQTKSNKSKTANQSNRVQQTQAKQRSRVKPDPNTQFYFLNCGVCCGGTQWKSWMSKLTSPMSSCVKIAGASDALFLTLPELG